MLGLIVLLFKIAVFVILFFFFSIVWFLMMEPVYNALSLEQFLDLKSFSEISFFSVILLFVFFRWWKNKPKICGYGESLPWRRPFFTLSFINPSDQIIETSYCKDHFLDEVEKRFANTKPVIFCRPPIMDQNVTSVFFTHADWKTNEFLDSDWKKIQTLLQNTHDNRPVLWNENDEILFPATVKGSFFRTEDPLLIPLTPQELKEKLRESLTKFKIGTYTLQLPNDIGIIITP